MGYKKSNYRILLIEPEERLRKVVARLLELDGAEVTAINDLMDAREMLRKLPFGIRTFNIVVIDRTNYHDKNHKKEVQLIRTLSGKAKLIATTGYIDDPILTEGYRHVFNKVVTKPYLAKDLIAI